MVEKEKKVVKKGEGKDVWFKKRRKIRDSDWDFIPVNWKGWVALLLLIGVNIFAANYFDIMRVSFGEVSKFLVVFLLSISVFILIARRKTSGSKNYK